ncbi:TetR family transcriptional regulator [Prauserella marina]|uniref:TetR/AcrR family transcriptional regulator n=1 Tax=Prauserella marina TaxID=530584 RepID=UPI000B81FD8C|nr:TetR/AcrR family transcriptional regulator [Prauserella marina]ASR39254.1 TetR family transcriptional regulator [Prauserella marina]
MVVFAAQGDPRRSMSLLWREKSGDRIKKGPGPKPGLSVDLIVETAISLADERGLPALSMRSVGESLGRTAMALYTYVPSKTELLDLMYDSVHAELPVRYDTGAGWRAALTEWAEDLWRFYLRHPWVLQVSQARPVLGPHEYAGLDAVLGIVTETGMAARRIPPTIGVLFHFVKGAARNVAEARQAGQLTGVSDEDWWFPRSAMLDEVAPDFEARFPVVAKLASEGAFDVDHDSEGSYLEREGRQAFEAGLVLVLDGLEKAAERGPAT